jgi:hypothetical protein
MALLMGCTTPVPPTVTQPPLEPLSADAEIFVVAVRQNEQVKQSLRDAGFRLGDRSSGDGYRLVVKVGRGRGNQGCGSINNVSYSLYQGSTRMMVMKGRGPTGACKPSIFDDMSRELGSYARSSGS